MTCENKLSFKSKDEAIAGRLFQQESGRDVRNLKPYKCREESCARRGTWHLGHDYSD